jgi:hypothetical protein
LDRHLAACLWRTPQGRTVHLAEHPLLDGKGRSADRHVFELARAGTQIRRLPGAIPLDAHGLAQQLRIRRPALWVARRLCSHLGTGMLRWVRSPGEYAGHRCFQGRGGRSVVGYRFVLHRGRRVQHIVDQI